MKKLAVTIAPLLLTAACISSPQKTQISYGNEQSMNCQQLEMEMRKAQGVMLNAKKDNKFKASHLFPPSAIASIINMNTAENDAKKRLQYLNSVYGQKNCAAQSAMPQTYNQGGQQRFAPPANYNQQQPPQYQPQQVPQQQYQPQYQPQQQYSYPPAQQQQQPQPQYQQSPQHIRPTDPVTLEELDEPVGKMPAYDPNNYQPQQYRYNLPPKQNPGYDGGMEQRLDGYGPSGDGRNW